MKYLVWVLSLFAAAVAFASASHNSAYVLLVYPPYRIELSFTLTIILLLLAFVLGYMMVRIVLAAMKMPDEVREFRQQRSKSKTRESLDEVLSAFFEGRYGAAEKAAVRAMESGETSALHPIIAARAAHELHEYDKRDAYLSTAGGMSIGDSTMRLMTSTKFMLDQRNPREALKILEELSNSGIKGHVGALSLELKAQQQSGNWYEVLRVLVQLEKRDAIDGTVADQIRQQAWLEILHQQPNIDGLITCLDKIPEEYKCRGEIARSAAQALIQYEAYSLARQIIIDSLNMQWDSNLAELYGDCGSGDLTNQIAQGEHWLTQRPQDDQLQLALGKLCLQQKLWDKAEHYLCASIELKPSKAAYHALSQLYERQGKSDAALKYSKIALNFSELPVSS
jgi:HemY protein